MIAVWIAVVAVLATIVVNFFMKHPRAKGIPLATAPQQILLGHAKSLASIIPGTETLCVKDQNKNGVCSFYLGTSYCVSVLKGEHIQQAVLASSFRKPIRVFDKHGNSLLGRRALTQLMGEEWRSSRKVVAKAFGYSHLQEMVADMNTVAENLTKQMVLRNGQEHDMWQIMKLATLDIIGMSGFGHEFGNCDAFEPAKFAVAFDFLMCDATRRQFESPLDPFSYFYSLPAEANTKHAQCTKIVRGILNEIIDKRKAEMAAGKAVHDDLLKYIIKYFTEDLADEKGVVDSTTMSDILLTLLFAGYDTSSSTVAYTLYLLIHHRDVETKCLEEIQRVLGDDGMPTYETLTKDFPYITAVIQESLRLYPPAPVTVRTLTQDMELRHAGDNNENVHLTKGTHMYIPIWWVHRQAYNFERPLEFDPERFLDEGAEARHRWDFVAFSAGPRDCVGRRFGMLQSMSLLISLIRKLRFTMKDDYKLDVQQAGVLQKPMGGLPMVATVRPERPASPKAAQ